MVNKETLDVEAEETITAAAEEDLVELGSASRETRGIFWGAETEPSILAKRLF